jgi:predicted dehydrogenase
MSDDTNYTLESDGEVKQIPAPELDYKPQLPKSYRPKIGLIGCGGITSHHLTAYKQDGLEVVAFCDLNQEATEERRKEFYPEAKCHTDYNELLADNSIDVVDIALHPAPRAAAIEAAINAGKHVLSQKPFSLDLDVATRLADLADEKGLKLAVNQNGRWAPYVRYIQQAINQGFIGDVHSINMFLNWDHTWIKGTAFETIHHIILYDFAVHWIDMTVNFFNGQSVELATGSLRKASEQTIGPPMMGGALLQFTNGFATLGFDGHSKHGNLERFSITGSKGTITASGTVCKINEIKLETEDGVATAKLEGEWFNDGFRGTMGELLCAIEEDRQPFNSGRNNLKTLEAVFATIASADSGQVVKAGSHRLLDDKCQPKIEG